MVGEIHLITYIVVKFGREHQIYLFFVFRLVLSKFCHLAHKITLKLFLIASKEHFLQIVSPLLVDCQHKTQFFVSSSDNLVAIVLSWFVIKYILFIVVLIFIPGWGRNPMHITRGPKTYIQVCDDLCVQYLADVRC